MKKYFLLILLASNAILAMAQQAIFADGSPAKELKAVDVVGTELYNINWQKAHVVLTNGTSYDLSVKYNLYSDQLFFLSQGVTMSFVTTPRQFTFTSGTEKLHKTGFFRNGYPKNGEWTENAYYQVLIDGNNQLLKKTSKQIMETKEFNSSLTKKNFIDVTKLFLFKNGALQQIRNDKSFFLGLFDDKSKVIAEFISTNKVNLKKEEGLIKIVKYYNSL